MPVQERIEGPEQSDSDSDSDGDETDSEDEDMVSDGDDDDDDDEHMVTEELAGIDLFDSVGSMLCLHEVRTIPM